MQKGQNGIGNGFSVSLVAAATVLLVLLPLSTSSSSAQVALSPPSTKKPLSAVKLSQATSRPPSATPRITICHHADDSQVVTIEVAIPAVPAHLGHHDTFGACGNSCACDQVFAPVTCSNGVTYANACFSVCAGASGCAPRCPCDQTFNPVTCSDGVTYANACFAVCAGCICPAIINPVLCTTGHQYDNECLGKLAGEECWHFCNCGDCPGGNPVTCADGKVYANSCVAECVTPRPTGCSAGGECYPPGTTCGCGDNFAPVICDNGNSYACASLATCLDQATGCEPACLFGCNATPPGAVHCPDGKTYTNLCYATCAGQTGCMPVP